ncbi:MAG TPA: SMC-Scp complex subunit ScpB [Hadesarchaea archaeon]|nr:SMC-Scp complex subunit ScpB [Hadesarchaea archaeon]
MGTKQDRSMIEAALYVADHPLTLKEIQEILKTSSETYARKLVDELKVEYEKRGGSIKLVETCKNTFKLHLDDRCMKKLGEIVPKTKISKGTLKTLAMIAYKQNLSQAKLAELRGNRVYDHIKQLLAMGFIESRPFGRTRMLRTSRKFAGYFGFPDDVDLTRELIEERMR